MRLLHKILSTDGLFTAPFRRSLLGFCLLCGLLLPALPGCAEGIVLDPAKPFPHAEITPEPLPDGTPSPSPSTPVEKIQVKVIEYAGKANQYKGLALPITLVVVLLMGLLNLLRWIYDLTTSSPPLA